MHAPPQAESDTLQDQALSRSPPHSLTGTEDVRPAADAPASPLSRPQLQMEQIQRLEGRLEQSVASLKEREVELVRVRHALLQATGPPVTAAPDPRLAGTPGWDEESRDSGSLRVAIASFAAEQCLLVDDEEEGAAGDGGSAPLTMGTGDRPSPGS